MTNPDKLLLEAETINEIKKALSAGANINTQDEENGCTILMYALMNDDEKMVKFLLENKADVNIRDEAGYAALMYAQTPKLARIIINAGADKQSKSEALASAYANKDAKMVAAIEGDGRIFAKDMLPHINEVKEKLKNKKRKGVISGTVVADKIADKIREGKVKETITPKYVREELAPEIYKEIKSHRTPRQ